MLDKITQIFKIKDLRKKIIFVLIMFIIFRVAASIPIPGIDHEKLREFFGSNQLLGLINVFTGGAMKNFSIVMLGLGPYITSTIILQLLTMIFPGLKEIYHESGEQGRQKFNQYGRLLTVPLAALQSYGFLTLLKNQGIFGQVNPLNLITNIVVITGGAIFLMWIGELISEKGIGNGVSLLIFAGIIAGIPTAIGQALLNYSPSQIPTYIIFILITIVVISGVVVINEAQRNIPVTYAKRVRGMRMYGGVSTYLPLRVNMAGVIPIIFALSLMLFPGMVANFLSQVRNPAIAGFARSFGAIFQNQWIYGILYFILVFLFTYFYTAITFDPKAVSSNLQKMGGFIPGIRPGESTAKFIYYILNRTTLIGAIFLGLISVAPFIVRSITGMAQMAIGGTAVLIVVSVVLETMKQIQAQLSMREY